MYLVCPPPPLAARSDRYNNDNLSEEEEIVENDEDGRNPFIKFDSQSRRMSILLSDWSLNSSYDSQDDTKRKFSEASSTTVTSEEGRLVEVVTLPHHVHSHTTHTHHTMFILTLHTHTHTHAHTHAHTHTHTHTRARTHTIEKHLYISSQLSDIHTYTPILSNLTH